MHDSETRFHHRVGAHLLGALAALLVGFPTLAGATWGMLQRKELDAGADVIALLLPPALALWALIGAGVLLTIATVVGVGAYFVNARRHRTAWWRIGGVMIVIALMLGLWPRAEAAPLAVAARAVTLAVMALVYEAVARGSYRLMSDPDEPAALDAELDELGEE